MGADGLFAGATDACAVTSELAPTAFTARRLTVYVVPFDRLLILNGLETEPTETQFEFVEQDDKQYSTSVIADPPFPPNVKLTSRPRSRDAIVVNDGSAGALFGVLQTSFEARPSPTTLTARN